MKKLLKQLHLAPDNEDFMAGTTQASTSKAQSRRAQVRSAQIRHRQRKANYIKQLESETNQYRDLITEAKKETSALKDENEAIKSRLGVGCFSSQSHENAPKQMFTGAQPMETDIWPSNMGEAETQTFKDSNINDLAVTLTMDEIMGTPSFQIILSPSNTGVPTPNNSLQYSDGCSKLSMAQENAAINFILALEHICWDHFHPSVASAQEDTESGHSLMASSYCMANAPSTLYEDLTASNSSSFEWRSPGVSLDTLRGLASSLNPGDSELTPVQAWFELADRYSPGLLLTLGVLEALKREFKGVVACVHYGAAMERRAFESVVERVMGQFVI